MGAPQCTLAPWRCGCSAGTCITGARCRAPGRKLLRRVRGRARRLGVGRRAAAGGPAVVAGRARERRARPGRSRRSPRATRALALRRARGDSLAGPASSQTAGGANAILVRARAFGERASQRAAATSSGAAPGARGPTRRRDVDRQPPRPGVARRGRAGAAARIGLGGAGRAGGARRRLQPGATRRCPGSRSPAGAASTSCWPAAGAGRARSVLERGRLSDHAPLAVTLARTPAP